MVATGIWWRHHYYTWPIHHLFAELSTDFYQWLEKFPGFPGFWLPFPGALMSFPNIPPPLGKYKCAWRLQWLRACILGNGIPLGPVRPSGFGVGNHRNHHNREKSFVKQHGIDQFEYFHHWKSKDFYQDCFCDSLPWTPTPEGLSKMYFPSIHAQSLCFMRTTQVLSWLASHVKFSSLKNLFKKSLPWLCDHQRYC